MTYPGYLYRPILNNLLALRLHNRGGLPSLLIATWWPNYWQRILHSSVHHAPIR